MVSRNYSPCPCCSLWPCKKVPLRSGGVLPPPAPSRSEADDVGRMVERLEDGFTRTGSTGINHMPRRSRLPVSKNLGKKGE